MNNFKGFRKLIITTFCIGQVMTSLAQSYKAYSKDSIVKLFITSEKVVDRFNRCKVSSSDALLILDPNRLLDNENIKAWLGRDLRIVNSGSIIDSIKMYDAHFLFKNQNNIFILRERTFNKETILSIHFPYSNIIMTARLRKDKGIFYLDKFESGVL